MSIHIIIPTKEEKKKFTEIVNEVINLIISKTKNDEEKAFILKMLVESFQETKKVNISIKLQT